VSFDFVNTLIVILHWFEHPTRVTTISPARKWVADARNEFISRKQIIKTPTPFIRSAKDDLTPMIVPVKKYN